MASRVPHAGRISPLGPSSATSAGRRLAAQPATSAALLRPSPTPQASRRKDSHVQKLPRRRAQAGVGSAMTTTLRLTVFACPRCNWERENRSLQGGRGLRTGVPLTGPLSLLCSLEVVADYSAVFTSRLDQCPSAQNDVPSRGLASSLVADYWPHSGELRGTSLSSSI